MENNVDWRTLSAGRELDNLIAETIGVHPIYHGTIAVWDTDCKREYPIDYFTEDGKLIASYSTDLNAWNNHVYVLWWSAGKWGASFDFDPPYDILAKDEIYARQIEYANTPALAVCRAYLGWKEATNE